jgi:hypothetical protein
MPKSRLMTPSGPAIAGAYFGMSVIVSTGV